MFRQRTVCFPGDCGGHNTSPEAHSNFLSVVVCQLVPSVKAIRGVWGPSGPLSQLTPLCNIYTGILNALQRHTALKNVYCFQWSCDAIGQFWIY